VPSQEDDKPLEQVASAFLRSFSKNDHFKVGCTICILLQDNLLTSSQVRPYNSTHISLRMLTLSAAVGG
jgi:hypothetical protein